jgi:hypothetical protein
MTEGTVPNIPSPAEAMTKKVAYCVGGACIAGWALLTLAIAGVMLAKFFG